MLITAHGLLFAILLVIPSLAPAQEDGWKMLKWGMSPNEVIINYDPDCAEYVLKKRWGNVDQLYECKRPYRSFYNPELLFYNEKFYKVFTNKLPDCTEDKNNYEQFLKTLKESYPEGHLVKFKSILCNTGFNYESARITVFTDGTCLHIYSTQLNREVSLEEKRLKDERKAKKMQLLKDQF